MRVTLKELKRLIRDQVERNMRWSAGIAPGGAGGTSHSGGGRMGPINYSLPGLGPEEEELDIDGEKQQDEKGQIGAREQERAKGRSNNI